MKILAAAVLVLVAWLTRRDRNPVHWPRRVRDEVKEVVRDAREALADGAKAGLRTEQAFDDKMKSVRSAARTW